MKSIRKWIHTFLQGNKTAEEKKSEKPDPGKKQDSKALIVKAYRDEKIAKGTVVIEGLGKRPKGSSLYLLRELITGKYGDLKIYWVVNQYTIEITESILKREGIEGVELILRNSEEYIRLMFSAEYLFTEVNFPVWWIKKPGQTYVNLWHGTPLKNMGKKKAGPIHKDSVASHNYTMADYMLMPSDYCIEHILADMDVLEITCAKAIMLGYPRTGILFDQSVRKRVRSECGFGNLSVIVWTPTWSDDDDPAVIQAFLSEMDLKLSENQIMFVNLHHRTDALIRYDGFTKIHPFPENYDNYEFLAAADIMISNYSSIFFDFAVTRKKIILHCPDKDEYLSSRGIYIPLEELPFPMTGTTDELIRELQSGRNYDDTSFLETFNPYDSIDNTTKLCDAVFLDKTDQVEIREFETNRNAVFVVVDSFRPGTVSKWLLEVYEGHDWNNDLFLSYPEKAAEEEISRIEPMLRGIRIFATKGKALGEDLERKKLYGDMQISRFVLIDPSSPFRIRAFSRFPEPVRLLLTDRQMETLRAGNEKMRGAVTFFWESKKDICVLNRADANWLCEKLGAEAEVISTKDQFVQNVLGSGPKGN